MRADYTHAFSSIGKFLMLLPLMFFFISGLNAQVTMGSNETPLDGALLQLKNKEGVTGKEENATKGLGLPRVKLTDINQLYPMYESDGSGGYVGANKIDEDPKHAGLMVYNLTVDLPFSEGVYIWGGEKWAVIAGGGGGGVTPPPCTKAKITSPLSDITISVTLNKFKALSANFTGTPTAMTWQKKEADESWTNIPGTNGNYYIPTQSGSYRFGVRDCETTTWYYSGNYIINVFDDSNYPDNKNPKLTINGINCFDTRETFNNDKGDGQNGKESARTVTASRPLPQGVTTYTISSTNGAIQSVKWIIEDKKGLLAAYSTENNAYPGDKLIATFVDFAELKARTADGRKASTGSGTDNDQVLLIKAYVTYVNPATHPELKTLLVKVQDFFCCDGAFVQNGAWDYYSGNPGDWAVGQTGVTSTTAQASPNMQGNLGGSWSTTTSLNAYFKPAAAGDICWYKLESTTKVTWPQAIQGCARGTYTDGDQNGWYLPNIKELEFLYETLDKAGNGGIQNGNQEFGSAAFFGGGDGALRLGTVVSGTEYWGSTEHMAGAAVQLNFNDGMRSAYTKATPFIARCVRRY